MCSEDNDSSGYSASEAIIVYHLQKDKKLGWRYELDIVRELLCCSTTEGAIAVLELTDNLTIQRLFAHHKDVLCGSVLKWLAFTQRRTVRKFVAAHPNTENKTLVWLSSDEDLEVRSTVAKNSHTPTHVLLRLAEDDYRPIRLAVVENPNTPPRVATRIREEESLAQRKNILDNWVNLFSSYLQLSKKLIVPSL